MNAPAGGQQTGQVFDSSHSPVALEVIGLSKYFGALMALEGVSFRLRQGSFHALLGGNGAGKSTLVKCVMGYQPVDHGTVLIGNRECVIESARDAHRHGLGMVYQHFTLVPDMTVLENLVLSRLPIPLTIAWKKEQQRLETLIAETPFRIPLHKKAGELAAGEKQKVELLKQLFLQPEILILDEPTSVLTPQEADGILGMLKERTRSHGLTVLIITHKFREVMNYADAVSVLRRGKLIYSGPLAGNTPAMLAELMIGNEAIARIGERTRGEKGPVKLAINHLSASSDTGALAVDRLSLNLHGGEIVGIAGVSGNGQRELVQVLSGQRKPDQGGICIGDLPYAGTRREMARFRFNCLPEEPLRNACVPRMSLAGNLALRVFDRPGFTRWRWFIDAEAQKEHAQGLIKSYRIHPPEPGRRIDTLSGGNVQRLVLARELSGQADMLIVANPCFGLDFAAASEVRKQLMQARNNGAAVLLVSEDLDELLELSDRIAVMFEGRLIYEAPIAEADLDEIGLKMAGH
ncbi:MAG: ABC transporter ATP-binding protein [Methylococcales bacterium]|nr:ABC transporter ATP-binding protein [Methylococcales bacterium]